MNDNTLIGVSVFRAVFCPANSDFMGFVVKGDGLWVDVPDAHTLDLLTAAERLEVTRHPTDNPNEIALKLPCTFAELRRFLVWAGYGDLDDADVADLERASQGRIMETVLADLWWQTEYDILELAQDFGERAMRDGKAFSQNAVAAMVCNHINSKESRKTRLGDKARKVSITRLKKGPMKGWEYTAK